VLDRLVAARGNPKTIRVDNGPEFAGRLLDQSAYLNGVELAGISWINISACRDYISNAKSSRCWHNQRGSAARLQILSPIANFAAPPRPGRAA